MNIIQSIVIKIASALGLKLEQKPDLIDDYSNVQSISLTAAIAQRVSTLTLSDSSVNITGDSTRALYLNDLYNSYIYNSISSASEVALGTGDCLLKPYTDGTRIGVDIIKSGDFYICESIGNFIKAVIVRCEHIVRQNGDILERYEVQRLSTYVEEDGTILNGVFIYQQAYKNGNQVPLSINNAWADLEPVIFIPNVKTLLLGRIKCPTLNRDNVNSPNGVPITYGLDGVMKNAVEAYNRMNHEFEQKEAFVFADKTLFKKDKNGKSILPKGKDRLFLMLPNQSSEGKNESIREYSPEIREQSFIAGVEQNFKMLELLAGLSSGILTQPTTNYATATEIRASLHLTYSYILKFRKGIEAAINDLFYAIDVLCTINNITPEGDYRVSCDWSSAFIENLSEQYARLIEAHSIGAASTAEVRAWLLDESIEKAEEAVNAISKTADNKL